MISDELFEGISILIPGYSVEDLPSDLTEDAASSLLNALACAWHPGLLTASRGIPVFRHPDAIRHLHGRQVILLPTPSESWMQHDTGTAIHLILSGQSSRDEWCDLIRSTLASRAPAQPEPDVAGNPSFKASSEVDSDLLDAFFAFGTSYLMTIWLSRRRHHFVDPDEFTLSREIHLAADAAVGGDSETSRIHLRKCFELLQETREQFFPLTCSLVDVCLPPAGDPAATVLSCFDASEPINLVATASDLVRWANDSPEFQQTVRARLAEGTLTLLTGPESEIRPALNPLGATLSDLTAGRESVAELFGQPVRHWIRRRYGLVSSLPMVLRHAGFESAFHIALDDGLYPDQERSRFEWMSPDQTTIRACSRIPLAIDSASSFLRFADRFNESMQDDDTAVLFLARLPELRSPWLNDLRIAARFASALGKFTTVDQFWADSHGYMTSLKFEHREYLSPALIQSSVLRTEQPITDPAAVCRLWYQLTACATLITLCRLIRADVSFRLPVPGDQTNAVGSPKLVLGRLRHLLRSREKKNADPPDAADDSVIEVSQGESSADVVSLPSENSTNVSSVGLVSSVETVDVFGSHGDPPVISELQLLTGQLACRLAAAFAKQVPGRDSDRRGIVLINTLPFARSVIVPWNAEWGPPQKSNFIQAFCVTPQNRAASGELVSSTTVNPAHQVMVQIPPGGYAWITESPAGAEQQPPLLPARREPPLAETSLLRNKHFEVEISEVTGGVAAVHFYGERSNRLSQRIGFRFERPKRTMPEIDEEESLADYAIARVRSIGCLSVGPLTGSVESVVELIDPSNGSLLAVVRQVSSLDRYRPRLELTFEITELTCELRGNPWMTYLACRFAWENEAASVVGSVFGQSAPLRGERFESPDYLEVADGTQRLTIAAHGRPYHRKTSPRSFDSLLICEGEQARSFSFTIDFDQPFPMRTALDASVPIFQSQTSGRIPADIHSAWLLGLTAKNVIIAEVNVVDEGAGESSDQKNPASSESSLDPAPLGLRVQVVLLETEGTAVDCLLRTAVVPVRAFESRPSDPESVTELPITTEGTQVRMGRFQLKEITLCF